jgi:hypothetical protein
MKPSFFRSCFAALLFALYYLVSGASAASERPKIGLVLSGCGARGAAHVGVIRFLEEQQIPRSGYVTRFEVVASREGLGADTFFGPVFLAYGHAEGGRDGVDFIVGQPF